MSQRKGRKPVAELLEKARLECPVNKEIATLLDGAVRAASRAARLHEETEHGGAACKSERVGFVALLACELGITADDFPDLADALRVYEEGPDAVYELNPERN